MRPDHLATRPVNLTMYLSIPNLSCGVISFRLFDTALPSNIGLDNQLHVMKGCKMQATKSMSERDMVNHIDCLSHQPLSTSNPPPIFSCWTSFFEKVIIVYMSTFSV